MPDMRMYVPAGILLAGCALIWDPRAQQSVPLAKPISTVMVTAPGYSVSDQVISPEEQRVAGMTNYVARVYRQSDKVAFTTLVSYYDRQTQGKTIHSPKNCLPGAGWEIMTAGTREFVVDGKTHTVNRYVLRNGNATALAYYWYQGRGRVTANEYRVKWNLLQDAALRGRTEEALVRLIVPLSPQVDQASADRLADAVGARLVREVEAVLPGAGVPRGA